MRIWFSLLVIALMTATIASHAEEAPSTATATTEPAATTPTISRHWLSLPVTYGEIEITADSFYSSLAEDRVLDANGSVEIKFPPMPGKDGQKFQLTFNAAQLLYYPDGPSVEERKRIGLSEKNARQLFSDRRPYLDKQLDVMLIRQAVITTCDNPLDHHHYDLRAKEITILPGDRYIARNVAVYLAGHRLFNIPSLSGRLTDQRPKIPLPSVTFGRNKTDGPYIGTSYSTGLGTSTTLAIDWRQGTQNSLRGNISLTHPLAGTRVNSPGVATLMTSWHEDVQNQLISSSEVPDDLLDKLTISRLPAVQLSFEPVALPGAFHNSTVSYGMSGGRYHEEPTNITQWRGQLWGIFESPHYQVGPLQAYGRAGLRRAFYDGGQSHGAGVMQLSLETPESSDIYFAASWLRRRESGSTPFLFDRVLMPDELATEVEFPLWKKSSWRLGLMNRQDLTHHTSRDFAITGIYRGDCLSYGVTYNPSEKGFSFGVILNGLDSFHKRPGTIAFTQ